MSKHTPGPWVVTPHPETHVDVFGVGKIMDDKRMQYGLSHTICYQNAEANARLIAAAPEMFEALDTIGGLSRALRQGGPDPMDLQGLSDALEEAVDLANSLIAQIEGRT